MDKEHNTACGRRIADQVARAGGTTYDAALAIHRHCGVTQLRGHRIAYGYTLVEVADRLRQVLDERGLASHGLAHQTVSRWETGVDSPTARYLDALCYLYRTRPDRLGFGYDYSEQPPQSPVPQSPAPQAEAVRDVAASQETGIVEALRAGLPGSARVNGRTAREAVEFFENRAACSGYDLYTSAPVDFVPDRMVDIAGIQKILLQRQPESLERRLYRVLAINAGFIGVRLTDVAAVQETFNWFGVAQRAARRAQDAGIEAWNAGHLCDAHACYSHSLVLGLDRARVAQLASGKPASSATLFGYLVEAGVQARLGRRRETLDAVRKAEQIFALLPDTMTAADGIHIPEYFLRWHQSNALTLVGAGRLADPLRQRALDLSVISGDAVGRSLLYLDQAALHFSAGAIDAACHCIRLAWHRVPADFHVGQIPSRTTAILHALPESQTSTAEVRGLVEQLRTVRDAASRSTA